MYIGVTCCVLGSLGYLITRRPSYDAFAQAGAELAVLFATVVLITGPLWGRKAWGVYWVWDLRLTTTLLGTLIFVGYLVLHGSAGAGESEKLLLGHGRDGRVRHARDPLLLCGSGGAAPHGDHLRGRRDLPEMKTTLGVSFLAFTSRPRRSCGLHPHRPGRSARRGPALEAVTRAPRR
ncbi:MAG: cytochrome c biogenesis protein CcsA [Polyangiales bacterium]